MGLRILKVVRACRKQDQEKPIAHYFGYKELIKSKGQARDRMLIKLVHYIEQAGNCSGCGEELHFDELTLDHIQPRSANGSVTRANQRAIDVPTL